MICKNHTRKTKHRATKNRGWTQVLRKGQQFPLHMWHPSCRFLRKVEYVSYIEVRVSDNGSMFLKTFEFYLNYTLFFASCSFTFIEPRSGQIKNNKIGILR